MSWGSDLCESCNFSSCVCHELVVLDYTNHRGERAMRMVLPERMWWGSTKWHPDPQWLLRAWDLDRHAAREFAMLSVHGWHQAK